VLREGFSTTPSSPFALALCQPGMERWLKDEVAKQRADLTPAYQRPGCVTFRSKERPFDARDVVNSVFARMWAASLGLAADPDAIHRLVQDFGARHLFLAHRDLAPPGEVAPARLAEAEREVETWRDALLERGTFTLDPPAEGDLVADVITAPGDPALVGIHFHGPDRHQDPAARPKLVPPKGTPSRAWAKLEEGLRWSRAPLSAGDRVLEIGSSPGGATRALVDRGLAVTAVDPQPLDPSLQERVEWIRHHIGDVADSRLPKDARWIVCDANIPPTDALGAIARVLKVLKGVEGLLWTLKLTDESAIEKLDRTLRRVEELGFPRARATQLASNGHELFVAAFRH
jgi:23S rRNA (cytidine2498-2'-O)-methyltransferase